MNTLQDYWSRVSYKAAKVSVDGKKDSLKPLFIYGVNAHHNLVTQIFSCDETSDDEKQQRMMALHAEIKAFHTELGDKVAAYDAKPKVKVKVSSWKVAVAGGGTWFVLSCLSLQISDAGPSLMLFGVFTWWLAMGTGNYMFYGTFKRP